MKDESLFELLFLMLLRLRENLLAILGAKWRKNCGMVIRQLQTIPEVISATLCDAINTTSLPALERIRTYVHSATGNR